MRDGPALAFAAAFLFLCSGAASAKETSDQLGAQEGANGEPLGGGKPVTTTIIKRCPKGYELVIRANGKPGCARDVIAPND